MSIILGNEPVSIKANGKEANLLTNQVANGTQYFCFDSGNGTKLYGEYKSLPVNLKLPTFEELKDGTFKEPFAASDYVTPQFGGWVKNNDSWEKLIFPETTVLIKEPTKFTAVYGYRVKVQANDQLISTTELVVGNKIQPLTNSWFQPFFGALGVSSWDDVDYFIVDQGRNIYKFYKDDVLTLTTLDEQIIVSVQKVPQGNCRLIIKDTTQTFVSRKIEIEQGQYWVRQLAEQLITTYAPKEVQDNYKFKFMIDQTGHEVEPDRMIMIWNDPYNMPELTVVVKKDSGLPELKIGHPNSLFTIEYDPNKTYSFSELETLLAEASPTDWDTYGGTLIKLKINDTVYTEGPISFKNISEYDSVQITSTKAAYYIQLTTLGEAHSVTYSPIVLPYSFTFNQLNNYTTQGFPLASVTVDDGPVIEKDDEEHPLSPSFSGVFMLKGVVEIERTFVTNAYIDDKEVSITLTGNERRSAFTKEQIEDAYEEATGHRAEFIIFTDKNNDAIQRSIQSILMYPVYQEESRFHFEDGTNTGVYFYLVYPWGEQFSILHYPQHKIQVETLLADTYEQLIQKQTVTDPDSLTVQFEQIAKYTTADTGEITLPYSFLPNGVHQAYVNWR